MSLLTKVDAFVIESFAGDTPWQSQARTVTELRGRTYHPANCWVILHTASGVSTPWKYDATSMAVDDGATILRPSDVVVTDPGRWLLDETGQHTHPVTGLTAGNWKTFYSNGSGVISELSLETTNTRKFLRSVGAGGVATAPAWDILQATDIPALNYAPMWAGLTVGSLIYANAATTVGQVTAVEAGRILVAAGATTAPAYTPLAEAKIISGTLTLSGNVVVPTTTATTGAYYIGASPFIHAYGTQNVFIGLQAGNRTTSGTGCNVGIGNLAMPVITTAANCFALGKQALYSLTDGGDNIAIGPSSLFSITSSYSNVSIGRNSSNFTTGLENVVIGAYAASAVAGATGINGNVIIGKGCLSAINTGGVNNVAIGYGIGGASASITGGGNTFVGERVAFYGNALSTASNNVCIGSDSARQLSTGTYNVFVGKYGGFNFSTADHIVALGAGAGYTYNTPAASYKLLISSASGAITNENCLIFGDFLTGGLSLGSYAKTFVSPPANGLILSGNTGIGTSAPASRLHIAGENATTNAVLDVLTIDRAVTGAGVGAAGLGVGIAMRLETSTSGVLHEAARINARWQNLPNASAQSYMEFGLSRAGVPDTIVSYLHADGMGYWGGGGYTLVSDAVSMGINWANGADETFIYSPANEQKLHFGGGATGEVLTIWDAVGAGVGIYNMSPAYPLDVTGDVNTTTRYRAGGTAGLSGTYNFTGTAGSTKIKTMTFVGGILTATTAW